MSPHEIEEPIDEPNPILHLVAPITDIGATMVMRKVLNAAYERQTGNEAPDPRDSRVGFGRALMWAIVTAAAAAAVETAVYRIMNKETH